MILLIKGIILANCYPLTITMSLSAGIGPIDGWEPMLYKIPLFELISQQLTNTAADWFVFPWRCQRWSSISSISCLLLFYVLYLYSRYKDGAGEVGYHKFGSVYMRAYCKKYVAWWTSEQKSSRRGCWCLTWDENLCSMLWEACHSQ